MERTGISALSVNILLITDFQVIQAKGVRYGNETIEARLKVHGEEPLANLITTYFEQFLHFPSNLVELPTYLLLYLFGKIDEH